MNCINILCCCLRGVIGICAGILKPITCCSTPAYNFSLLECCIKGYICIKLLKCCDDTKTAINNCCISTKNSIKDFCESIKTTSDAEPINDPYLEGQPIELGGESV